MSERRPQPFAPGAGTAEGERLSPFRSFCMGGFEGADHCNRHGVALDMARLSGHLDHLDADYAAAAAHGLLAVRESIGWRLCEPRPGRYDFSRVRRIAETAARHRVQVLWTFMHYGCPADVNLLDDGMIARFAAFAAAAARELAPWHGDAAPVYTPINEISFLAWAASATALIHPYRGGDTDEASATSGYCLKRRLVRAALAAMREVRAVSPQARFLHVDPVVHVVAPRGRPDLAALAATISAYQWQAWDLLAGRGDDDVGGEPAALDLIGINHYHSGQWEAGSEKRLCWHGRDARRRPLAELIGEVHARYDRPLVVTETSHFGAGRAAWFNEVAAELRRVQRAAVPLYGVCLYPLVDRPDWDVDGHWHRSGLWDAGHDANAAGTPPRRLVSEYAAALARWRPLLTRPYGKGRPMRTLIVFSHLRWNFVYQRPQQLMSRLARQYRVLFVEEPLYASGPARLDCQPQDPNLDVLCPFTPVDAPGFHDAQLGSLSALLAEYLQAQRIDDYFVWFYTPLALPLISGLRPRAVIYDCMDELSAFKDAPRQLRQRESALLRRADLVLTGGPSLYEAKRRRHGNVHCLPSAVDAAHFAPACLDPATSDAYEARALMSTIPRPRLGFFGVVDERFDVALLAEIAARRPGWHFVIVGPVVKIDPAILPRAANIHWLGMQPYVRLPYFVAAWDVCVMPFARNEATRFISPTKTLEYLAAEKPVVSTAIRDVVNLYGDVVRIAHTSEEFVAACHVALGESAAERAARLAAARAVLARFSWERSARTVAALLDAAVAPPRTPLRPAAAPPRSPAAAPPNASPRVAKLREARR